MVKDGYKLVKLLRVGKLGICTGFPLFCSTITTIEKVVRLQLRNRRLLVRVQWGVVGFYPRKSSVCSTLRNSVIWVIETMQTTYLRCLAEMEVADAKTEK
jgi:hypothetical protein